MGNDKMIAFRQIFLALVAFTVLLLAMIVRSYIYDRVFSDKEWAFKKHWKSAIFIAALIAIAFFIYLRVTGQVWL